jgi:succinate dehydrogenase / fumarate reductase cytochrome b subunit
VTQEISFFERHEFMIRRLHSLSGLIPIGAFMVVHLLANASINNGTEAYQKIVYQIHSLGPAVLVVEWLFIFLPIIFHALLGFVFIFQGKSNVSKYPYQGNYRYVAQRVTGMIAFFFILWHVLQMNGVIHADWFRESIADPVGLAQFRPYNAASTAAKTLQNPIISGLYAIGILACVFHFANGLWTMGITWGVWVSPKAQKMASHICLGVGAIIAVIGLSALVGFYRVDIDKAEARELEMYEQGVKGGTIQADPHKLIDSQRAEQEKH